MTVLFIVLKVILWILLSALGIIVIACILPISAKVSYLGGKFAYKASYSFVPLMDSDGGGLVNRLRKRRKKPKKDDNDDDEPEIEEVPEMSEHHDIQEEPQEDITEESHELPEEDIPENQKDSKEDITEDSEEDEDFPDFDDDDCETDSDSPKKSGGKSLGDKIELLLDIWRAADRPLLKIFKGFHFNDVYIDFIVADEDAYKCAVNYGMISGTVYNLLAWLGALFTLQFRTVDINAGFALKENRWDASSKIKFRLGTLVIAGIWFLITYLFKIYIPNKRNAKILKAAESAD